MTRAELIVAIVLTAVYIAMFDFVSAREWVPEWLLMLSLLPILAFIWSRHIVARLRRERLKREDARRHE